MTLQEVCDRTLQNEKPCREDVMKILDDCAEYQWSYDEWPESMFDNAISNLHVPLEIPSNKERKKLNPAYVSKKSYVFDCILDITWSKKEIIKRRKQAIKSWANFEEGYK